MTDKYKQMLDEMLGVCRKYLDDLKDDERYWKVKTFIVRERTRIDVPHLIKKMNVLYVVSVILIFMAIPCAIIFAKTSEYVHDTYVIIMGFNVHGKTNILGMEVMPGQLFYIASNVVRIIPISVGLGIFLYTYFKYELLYKKLKYYYLSK